MLKIDKSIPIIAFFSFFAHLYRCSGNNFIRHSTIKSVDKIWMLKTGNTKLQI